MPNLSYSQTTADQLLRIAKHHGLKGGQSGAVEFLAAKEARLIDTRRNALPYVRFEEPGGLIEGRGKIPYDRIHQRADGAVECWQEGMLMHILTPHSQDDTTKDQYYTLWGREGGIGGYYTIDLD